MNAINFNPWVSEAYKNGNGIYGKLLIMGESHYIDDEEEDDITQQLDSAQSGPSEFTTSIVDGFINKKWELNFFRNLGLLFNKNDQYEIWENVAFANAIQVGLKTSTSQPTIKDISTVIPAFWELLELLKPGKILICSKRMWNNWMPDSDTRCQKIGEIECNGKYSTIWEYNYENGRCTAIGINHPSSYFSYSNWEPLVKMFLERPIEK